MIYHLFYVNGFTYYDTLVRLAMNLFDDNLEDQNVFLKNHKVAFTYTDLDGDKLDIFDDRDARVALTLFEDIGALKITATVTRKGVAFKAAASTDVVDTTAGTTASPSFPVSVNHHSMIESMVERLGA
jgi:hypothetical protein